MTLFSDAADLGAPQFAQQFSRLGDLFQKEVAEPLTQASLDLSSIFESTFSRFESALKKAARTGELDFKQMVNSILADMSRLAFEKFVSKPVTGFLEQIAGQIFSFGGARAIGGTVAPGQSYLVGERGPELFVPGGLGRIQPLSGRAAPAVSITIHTPDVEGFRRSEQQVSAMLARAVRRGSRGL